MGIRTNLTVPCFYRAVLMTMTLILGVWAGTYFVVGSFAQSVERLDLRIDDTRNRGDDNARALARHEATPGHKETLEQIANLSARMAGVETKMAYGAGGAALFTFLVTLLQVLSLFGVRFRIGRRNQFTTIGAQPTKENDDNGIS